MQFSEGSLCEFKLYPVSGEFPEVTEIMGTKGRLSLEQPAHCPTRITVRIPPQAPSRYADANNPSPFQVFDYPLSSSIEIPNAYPNQKGFSYMIDAIHRCIASDHLECPQFDREASIHLLEIVCAINGKRKPNPKIRTKK